jgi:hypothetical protein
VKRNDRKGIAGSDRKGPASFISQEPITEKIEN